MRVSEFIHFLNRKDIGLGVNPPEREKKDDKTIKNSRRSSRKDK